ncbi:MAG: EF-hand domain-containing protein [Cyanobacteria bacterium P01_D01_bin.50]
MKKAFAYLDKNQDGYISPPELQSAISLLFETLRDRHALRDRKNNRESSRSLINMMFETLDVDGNGMVSMEKLASLAM